jgi:glycosyltransferase involved in cell wall biosynthesis
MGRRRVAVTLVMATRRPRLLFLAWHFPPANTVACIRTWNVAKHLARRGWELTVVTPDPSLLRHVERVSETERTMAREGIRRIVTGHRWRALMPHILQCRDRGLGWFVGGICRNVARRLGIDAGVGWIREADRACAHLTADDVDVILASGPPFAAFDVARRLSDRLSRPYVLDYRDPWTGFPHALVSPRPATIRRERRLLACCAAATIVSPSWASALDRRFGVSTKLHVVTNGYDGEELAPVLPHQFGHVAIVYAGIFYVPKRPVTPLMAALKALRESGPTPPWYFHYYGPHGAHVSEEAHRFGLAEHVVLHGTVSRPEALAAVRGAAVAVVITSVVDNPGLDDNGMVTGKIFETLGLRTPIMLVAPSGSDARAVVEGSGAGRAFAGGETAGMAAFLRDQVLHQARATAAGSVYEWAQIAERLDTILRRAQAGLR